MQMLHTFRPHGTIDREAIVAGKFTYNRGIAGFDQIFGLPMREFVPTLLQMAGVRQGQRILDVATGTGVAAEAALKLVGQAGHVTAIDVSEPMLDKARERLAAFPNVAIRLENAEALSFPDNTFDAVICCMSLHVFHDEKTAADQFYRVLRNGGSAAVSVNTTAKNSLTGYLRLLIAKHVPAKRAEIEAWCERQYRLGDADRLRRPLEKAGFRNIEAVVETRHFTFPSFDAYFDPIASGGGPWGAEFEELSVDVRQTIRSDLKSEMEAENGPGQPVGINVRIQFASGRK
jgi:ubiquinone/menaquinone biosynthesis C-methylase UbiE